MIEPYFLDLCGGSRSRSLFGLMTFQRPSCSSFWACPMFSLGTILYRPRRNYIRTAGYVGGAEVGCLLMAFLARLHTPAPPKCPKEWTLDCLYSLFWDLGPLFWALLEVQASIQGMGFYGGLNPDPRCRSRKSVALSSDGG